MISKELKKAKRETQIKIILAAGILSDRATNMPPEDAVQMSNAAVLLIRSATELDKI